MPATLFRVIVPVSDMERAVACYSRLLDSPGESVAPTRYYFRCGETILALVDPSEHERAFQPNPDLIYFAVPDLDETYHRAREAGCTEMDGTSLDAGGNEIGVRPWGERSFYARDPFGNPLCFVDDQTLFTGSGTS